MKQLSTIKKTDWQVPSYVLTEYRAKKSKYCVCIPIINEGERIIAQLDLMKDLSKHIDILILDGGSKDGSTDDEIMKRSNVRALLVKTGAGKLSAQLRMGYAYALKRGYKGIITVDGNGKDGVEAVPSFVTALDEGFDYVQGSRFIKGGQAIRTPKVRLLGIRLVHAPLLSLCARHWLTDTTNGFRGYRDNYLTNSKVQPFRDIFSQYELLAYLSVRASQLGLKVKEIPVRREYPASGKVPTKISHFRGNLTLIQTVLATLIGKYNPAKN